MLAEPRRPAERRGAPPAERADRAVDEPLVAGAHVVGPDAEPLGRAGAQALDERVGLLGEAEQRVPLSSLGRSSASDRLPAFAAKNITLQPCANSGPTSAPSAARICVQ